jgi:hypothetical protein
MGVHCIAVLLFHCCIAAIAVTDCCIAVLLLLRLYLCLCLWDYGIMGLWDYGNEVEENSRGRMERSTCRTVPPSANMTNQAGSARVSAEVNHDTGQRSFG